MYDFYITDLIAKEKKRQEQSIELIASENYVSSDVLRALGSVLTNKYAEGLPHKRYYGGCEYVDEIESKAIERAKTLFNATWANVQPHSGSQANAAAFLGFLNHGDKIMGFDLAHGGHLTHGSKVNFSGKIYNPVFYGVDPKTHTINMNMVEEIALREKPKIIVCGGSSYSREWDFASFRNIADKVNAVLMGDIAHIAGLVATKHCQDALRYCHFCTSTTHKTLRGPRGGLIVLREDIENFFGIKNSKGKLKKLSRILDSAVFPGTQGGPLMHVIAAKAISFSENIYPTFQRYILQVIKNAKALVRELKKKDYKIISGDTDNHMLVIDLTSKNITGKEASRLLEKVNISVNKNLIPFDKNTPSITSGIRIGSPAITTRGLLEYDMQRVVFYIDEILKDPTNEDKHLKIKREIENWMSQFPFVKEIIM